MGNLSKGTGLLAALYEKVISLGLQAEADLKQSKLDSQYVNGYQQGRADALREMQGVLFSGALQEKLEVQK